MTVGSGKRQYRACQRCRRRKTRCDLSSIGEVGKPPCLDCFRTGQDCTLSTSRRGGDYSQYRKSRKQPEPVRSTSRAPSCESPAPWVDSPLLVLSQDKNVENSDSAEEGSKDDPFNEELRNPSDALHILSRSTDRRRDSADAEPSSVPPGGISGQPEVREAQTQQVSGRDVSQAPQQKTQSGIKDYALVAKGLLRIAEIHEMLQIYATNYHPFLPIVPNHILAPRNIDRVARDEAFLLTIILTIASKDDPDLNIIHHHCCQHTKRLLLDVLLAIPSTFGVGTVEGLLVLAEWLPYINFTASSSSEPARGNFPEDNTAWSLIGQAIRHAYLLRLDRMSFFESFSEEKKRQVQRERIAWTFVFLADRQISVRMGQSFWSRGSSLSTKFTIKDFSTLRPLSESDNDDYASIHLATMEMTQLLHNVHDIMYSSRPRTLSMIFTGDYNRYLDDFHKGLLLWHTSWDQLDVSPKLKSTLTLMYEYLNLYVNSFSFQAVITRSSRTQKAASPQSKRNPKRHDLFPGGVMASPDGRYIHDAIRSAKVILQTFNSMEPDTHLRFMPFRYYLYGIFAAVFLSKAEAFGALLGEAESQEVFRLIKGFVTVMSKAASCEHHVGWRYSQLLMALCSSSQRSKPVTNQPALATNNVTNAGLSVSADRNMTGDTLQYPNEPGNGPNITDTADQLFPAGIDFSAPFQINDVDFPTPDATWMNFSLDAAQNFFTIESPFALNEMWGVPQF